MMLNIENDDTLDLQLASARWLSLIAWEYAVIKHRYWTPFDDMAHKVWAVLQECPKSELYRQYEGSTSAIGRKGPYGLHNDR